MFLGVLAQVWGNVGVSLQLWQELPKDAKRKTTNIQVVYRVSAEILLLF